LAAGKITFKKVGKKLDDSVVKINFQQAVLNNGIIRGNIPVLDIQYGNVWTNITDSIIYKAGFKYGDSLLVEIFNRDSSVFQNKILMVKTFGAVAEQNSLGYFNSLMNFSLAINQGSFSNKYKIQSGPEWSIRIARPN
jgi:S-adenosylmethionine hydrolase